ncbi:membrane-spanning 4-domains subfamily A member 15-like [Myripristis murdjan]|uniref:membrane-spanning 4-domains subfamily A member 15-like n=1 Tax=Myripristis murdjan TaxID=586833 RepID=UPI001175F3DD|nr:membrane-spanning 4-domains subfamily A member 15-like [Myripristis murdjan]
MSAELISVCEPQGNTDVHGTSVGGSKPLHRFIRGQPKIVGTVVLIFGSSFFILSISMVEGYFHQMWRAIPPGFWLGAMYIICGIVYILTEHRPTKKTVTLSLGLSIVAVLASFWGSVFSILPGLIHSGFYDLYSEYNNTDNAESDWSAHYMAMEFILEAILEFYILVCIIIFIVMSSLSAAALRSTKSQALMVMTTTPTE